jgi:hypothetical protein
MNKSPPTSCWLIKTFSFTPMGEGRHEMKLVSGIYSRFKTVVLSNAGLDPALERTVGCPVNM